MWSLSKPIGTIFVLISIFLFSQPAQAKYGGGSGTAEDPYQIATAEDLIALGESPDDYDKDFILIHDIDLAGHVFDRSVIAADPDPTTEYFEAPAFAGVFDGNGHIISNLTIRGGAFSALFGVLVCGGEVRDLGIVDVNITGLGDYAAVVVAWNEGTVTRCYGTGRVSGYSHVGGLAGLNFSTLRGCYTSAMVSGSDNVGGLVGGNAGVVRQCYSNGLVKGKDFYIGGLVGGNDGEVTVCYSTGVVDGNYAVGGLVGYNCTSADVNHCYGSGLVSATGSRVGGLVGMNRGGVVDCYSSGRVTGSAKDMGGLVGWSSGGEVGFSFWDMQLSGQPTSAGGTGKSTVEMQTASTFLEAGWDFVGETKNGTEDIWTICEGKDYPKLTWQFVPGEFNDDRKIDLNDLAILSIHWRKAASNFFWCHGPDLTNDGSVDFEDLMVLTENWLAEGR